MEQKEFFIYIMTNKPKGTLYVGLTSNLPQRLWQHRNGHFAGFTREYNLHRLVYFEHHPSAESAIRRERRLKHWPRRWKVDLIEGINPTWCDLAGGLDPG